MLAKPKVNSSLGFTNVMDPHKEYCVQACILSLLRKFRDLQNECAKDFIASTMKIE